MKTANKSVLARNQIGVISKTKGPEQGLKQRVELGFFYLKYALSETGVHGHARGFRTSCA